MLLVSSLGSYNLRAFSVVSGSTSVLPGGRQGSEDPALEELQVLVPLTQRAQYPLIKEYGLNYIRLHIMS